ncbi:MAG: glycosyltransferase N-terminal domain-containing protein [Pseudomonadota bacterium]
MSSKPIFSLATYFARRTSDIAGPYQGKLPPRPSGTVIWVWATDLAQVETLRGLEDQLAADGDQITLIITLPKVPDTAKDEIFVAPVNRSQTNTFLTHWRPDLMLWMRDKLEPSVLVEASDREVPCILLEATTDVVNPEHGGWVPGMARALLQQFRQIFTKDDAVSAALIRNGAEPAKVKALGMMETAPAALPHFEDERQQTAKLLGSRPVWLAVDTDLTEVALLSDAHHHAALRSHRLLLIAVTRTEEEGPEMAAQFRDRGFLVALRSADEEPDDATQIYVADYEGELGLWYRLAPISYMGGSLSGGPVRNPFEAATLGSAVVHGPVIAPYEAQFRRLATSDACVPVPHPASLGGEIEGLLAPDKAALVVHAAWDVTSRGAEVTTRVAEILMAELDTAGR